MDTIQQGSVSTILWRSKRKEQMRILFKQERVLRVQHYQEVIHQQKQQHTTQNKLQYEQTALE